MIFVVYNLLLTITFPLWLPWMLWRSMRRREKPNWAERMGDSHVRPRRDRKRVWIHAVSVGEVLAAVPILRRVRDGLPDFEIVLSVTTSSGHETARKSAAEFVDHLIYFPIDVARFQLAAASRVQPAVVAIMETELWMNFLWAVKTFDSETMIINGRISDRSFPRKRRVRFFYADLLRRLDLALMQTDRDAARIKELGAAQVEVLGNVKFDQADEGRLTASPDWRKELGVGTERSVLVIGSTRSATEEALVMEALHEVGWDRFDVVWAPRHLERAEAIVSRLHEAGQRVARRSRGEKGSVLLLDSYGELASVYAAADIVVIGGGFDQLGGQNPIQALAHGKPVVFGPHMTNFRDVAEMALAAGTAQVASSSHELAAVLRDLLADAGRRQKMGDAARELVTQNLGAADRYAARIVEAARRVAAKRGKT